MCLNQVVGVKDQRGAKIKSSWSRGRMRCVRLARLENGEQSRGRSGVENCQGLKMKSGDVADLTLHAGNDLPALRTTPFEGEEDDEGRSPEYPAYTSRSIRSGRSI